jgi:hypothetical protein
MTQNKLWRGSSTLCIASDGLRCPRIFVLGPHEGSADDRRTARKNGENRSMSEDKSPALSKPQDAIKRPPDIVLPLGPTSAETTWYRMVA